MNYTELKNNLPTNWWATDASADGRMRYELVTALPEGHILKGGEFTVDAIREDDFDLLCHEAHGDGRFTVVHFAPGCFQHLAVLFQGSFQGFLDYEVIRRNHAQSGRRED